MIRFSLLCCITLFSLHSLTAQTIQDNFEGSGNISLWFGDNCVIDTNFTNPVTSHSNNSNTVLRYHDIGGQYANVRFDVGRNLNLSNYASFSLKIYVPSSGITGTQNNQISLKLQDGNLAAPWSTQSEIIKPIALNTWQTVTFDFATDPYINLDGTSPPPIQRTDFNRILLQINGENNTDQVLAYIDDFFYFDSVVPPPPPPVYNNLVWSDEFNTNGAIDASKWFHQTQLPQGGSWFNGEIQHYTNRTANASVNNGVLNLIAKRETFTDQGHTKQYTSARLNSKFAFTYGKVEVRAKLPTGVGTWPAIWMLGQNITETGAYWHTQNFGTTPWPACGEIDIMEHWGNNQNFVQSATHTTSSSGATVNHGGQVIPTASSAFHTYTLEWRPDRLIFSVDSVVHYTYQPSVRNAATWPFDAPQYMLFNIAIQPSITPSFTQDSMNIDYIRIYQQTPVGITESDKLKSPSLFPNPVEHQFTLELSDGADQNCAVDIYSVEGKQIISKRLSVSKGQINVGDLHNLKSGLYFVTVTTKEGTFSSKFVKK